MAISDAKRLARIDGEILDLEYLYTREIVREQEIGKKNLLVSNGYKYRLENLKRARARLREQIVQAPTKKMNYAILLAERKEKLSEAETELEYMNKQYTELMTKVLVTRDDASAQDALSLAEEIKKQRMRVVAFDRAVTQFIERSFIKTQRTPRKELEYNPEEDIRLVEKEPSRTIESLLGNDPLWNQKAVNPLTFDMLKRPEELEAEKNQVESKTSSETAFDYFNKEPIYAEKIDKPRIVIDDE